MAKLSERIDAALVNGPMSFYDLAMLLYPEPKSWRYQSNGGPPGCFMSLSACINRSGFHVGYRNKGAGPGNRIVYPRSARTQSEKR